jgi:hypothetical protein
MSPRSRERLRGALKGFSSEELEPRTSEGELVADLLAKAGAEFQRKSGSGRKPQRSRGASPGSCSSGSPSPFQVTLRELPFFSPYCAKPEQQSVNWIHEAGPHTEALHQMQAG